MSRTIAMVKGTIWAPERKQYDDPLTGVQVHQLTDYRGHSRHLHFTQNGLYDEGRRLLFVSDRDNSANLFSIHLVTGEMTQLTTYTNNDELGVCLTPDGQQALLQKEDTISLLDLTSFRERVKYRCPEGFRLGNISCTADGESVLTCIWRNRWSGMDYEDRNLPTSEASPLLSQIITIDIQTGRSEIIHEEPSVITHVHASPVHPWLLTFCHEDPWSQVDHRIWGMDLRTGEVWPIHSRVEPGEAVEGEHFLNDGEMIGYHGIRSDGTSFWGSIRYDNSNRQEQPIPFAIWHAYLDSQQQTVTDGQAEVQTLSLWRRSSNGAYDGPRILCELKCSFHSNKVHSHPIITPDGRRLFYTSDRTGYANIYMVELPDDITTLPLWQP
ncbi:oligogalacturonate lyase family protein [Paenibacillus wulumuqiensis]|uniref:oligogalacturonate lyase family protein n=1 Tax=Paenibacillus wulumuqiensis TaxID=1567107 RepID=UPI000AA36801|nr:oligogalacturonate lyase family protein [Paenibacillus wulumuqiensis]